MTNRMDQGLRPAGRRPAGRSQRELAARAPISARSKTDASRPRPPIIVAICRVLDSAPDTLGRALAFMRGQAHCILATPDESLSYTRTEASQRRLPVILRRTNDGAYGQTVIQP